MEVVWFDRFAAEVSRKFPSFFGIFGARSSNEICIWLPAATPLHGVTLGT
jgi:hypothetical protein